MKVIITAATSSEWMATYEKLNQLNIAENLPINIDFCLTGVGILSSAVALTTLAINHQPDLIIQMGISGAFNDVIPLGKVVIVENEMLGDLGVEENGTWKDLFDLNLVTLNTPPFNNGKLSNPWLQKFNLLELKKVNAITVNQISTNAENIKRITNKYQPELESMEGASLHYIALKMGIPFLQIRGVSNYVGERDKTKWFIKESISNLNQTVIKYIEQLIKLNA